MNQTSYLTHKIITTTNNPLLRTYVFSKWFIFLTLFLFSFTNLSGQSIAVSSITSSPTCAGASVTITFNTTNGIGPSNLFSTSTLYTIYLSDAAGTIYTSQGTFTTPSVSYTGGDGGVTTGITQNFTLPIGLADGTGYNVALSSTTPTFDGSSGSGASPAFTVYAIPTTSNAGPNQGSIGTCGITEVTLAANTPVIGTGSWSILIGTGGSFADDTDPTTTFTGVAGNAYTLRWTISNAPCTPSVDNVVITFNQNPTTANAGPNQGSFGTCGQTQVTLAANTPVIGTGQWSIISGVGGSFANDTDPTTVFTGINGNAYTLRWTISNSPCAPSFDNVVITFNQEPDIANAGPDQIDVSTCGLTQATLAANTPAVGTGQWTIVSGTGGSFADDTDPTTTFTGINSNSYILRWTISNSPCNASVDDVNITFNQEPDVANAGPDQTGGSTCGLTQITLAANTPVVGAGQWSVLSGAGGSFISDTDPGTTFNGVAGNSYTLRWTITNGVCTSTDEMDVTFNTNSTDPIGATSTGNNICPLVSVDLDVVGGSLGTGAQWVWYSGSCGGVFEGTGATISVSPSITTTYYVRAEGDCGNTACQSVTVIVDPGSLAGTPGGITGTILTCDGETGVSYSVQPAVNAVAYNWTAPSGASIASGAGTQLITVDFPNPYTNGDVCVVAENACGVVSATRCLTVTNVANFTPNRISGPTNICENSTGIVYNALKVRGATNYNWTLPSGMTITSGAGTRTIVVDAGAVVVPGPICVSVDYSCGTSLVYCKNISINATTSPGGITGPSGVCANNTGVAYSVPPVSGVLSYTWTAPTDFNIVSGQGTGNIVIDIGANPAAGNVCVTADFSCGSSVPRCLPVSISGASAGNISGLGNVCSGATGVSYSVADVPDAISYNWTFPAGVTQASGGSTRFITVDFDPSFEQGDICVTVTSPCGTSAASCKTIKDFSQTLPGGITGPNIVCQGATGLAYSVQPVSGAVSYEWVLPPGVTLVSGLNTSAITVDIDNSFTIGDIGVRAVSACPSKSLIRWNSKITSIAPAYPGTISASASICQSTTVSFSVTTVSGADSYIWTLPAGMTFTAGPPTNTNVISVDISGTFVQGEVCVQTVSACGVSGNMRCQTFNINLDTPGSISGPAGVCPGQTGLSYSVNPVSGASSYNWELPSGWNITSGTGTNSIVVDVPAGFIAGQMRVNAVSSCGNNSGYRKLNVSYIPATPGAISGTNAVCNGNTYIYSIDAVNGAASYEWTLPAGVSFTAGPPVNTNSVSVDVSGSFTGGDICVTASTACGGPSAQRCFTLNTTPDAAGAISGPATVCQSATNVVYSIESMSGISNYTWTVPANISIVSGQGTNTLTVDVGGSFVSGQLCVVAENLCGDPGASGCLDISLTPGDPSAITASVNFCAGGTGTLTVNEVSGAAYYNWVLPAGLTLLYGQGTAVVTVSVDGAFASGNVCVTAESDCGALSGQYCEIINLSPAGTPSDIIASATVCPSSGVTFSVPVVTGAGSYNWSLPTGLSVVSGQGTATLNATAGPSFTSGDVCVTAVSGCGVSGTQYCENFSITPATPGNINAPASLCASGPNAVLSVTEVQGVSEYDWTVPGGVTIVNGQGSNVITVSAGPAFTSGVFTVAALSSCAEQSGIKSVTLGTSVNTPGSINAPPAVCANATGLEISVPVLTGAVSYNWVVPANITITSGQNTNKITVDAGAGFTSGQICVSGVSECGVTGPQRCKNLISLPNTPGGVSGVLGGVCDLTLAYSVPNATGATSYTWTAPAGATITNGQGTRFVNVTFSDTFTSGQLSVYSSNSCGNSAVRTSSVITGAPAKPTLIAGPNSVCNNQTGINYFVSLVFGASNYTWTVPAGASITSGQGTTSINVDWGTTAGQVSVVANNLCGSSTSSNLTVAITCRVSSGITPAKNLSVYPNPSSGEFIVQYDSETESSYAFDLTDLSGRTILHLNENALMGTNYVDIKTGDTPAGTYLLRITGADGSQVVSRVVIQ